MKSKIINQRVVAKFHNTHHVTMKATVSAAVAGPARRRAVGAKTTRVTYTGLAETTRGSSARVGTHHLLP